jgi:phosphoribosylglycinamide formyltransferase 1
VTARRRKTAILISGRGSNMAALIDAAAEPGYPAEIVGVISDRPEAAGLKLAAAHGHAYAIVPRSAFASKAAHDQAIDEALRAWNVEMVCLAGYMRILTADFVSAWQGRMINIHPSLLPLFKGLDTHQRAIDAGMRIHGCTVHFVTPVMDDGPIIAQAAVRVTADDDAETLGARVLKAEHRLYADALRLVCEGRARMEGSRTVFSDMAEREPRDVMQSPDMEALGVDLERLARSTP